MSLGSTFRFVGFGMVWCGCGWVGGAVGCASCPARGKEATPKMALRRPAVKLRCMKDEPRFIEGIPLRRHCYIPVLRECRESRRPCACSPNHLKYRLA